MIRRYLLHLLFLPLLLTFTNLSYAETIPATGGTGQPRADWFNTTGYGGPSGDAACMAWVQASGPDGWTGVKFSGNYTVVGSQRKATCTGTWNGQPNQTWSVNANWYCPSGTPSGSVSAATNPNDCTAYTCPSGQNWTLQGTTCTRPDCSPGTSRDENGVCLSACQQVANLMNGQTAWYSVPVGSGQAMGSYCDSGCAVSLGVAGTGYYTDGKNNSFQRTKHYSGSSCANEPNAPTQFTPEKQPPTPEKKPPCAAGEGVMTSSSGTIGCVPEGTPNSNPPIVKKEKSTTTNPDNTTTTNETTTTRDPATGVEQRSTSTTSCSGTNCTTSTTSGTSGTTTGGNPEKPGDSDFCQKNPTLDICTGKLAKEETLGKIKDALDPKEAADKSKLDAAKQDFDDKQKAHKDFIDAFAAKAQSDEGGLLKWAMIPEVPAGSCVPFTGTVMGRVVTFDFCDSLAKVRDIAGYGFYLMTMFALFAIFASSTTSGGKS